MEAYMDWISLILSLTAGLLLLFAGRRFFWLAAALAAFLFTFSLFEFLFGGGWLGLIIAVIVGVIFAFLARMFIKIVGYIVGAFAGAVGLPSFLGLIGLDISWLLAALIGALVGFLLMLFLFDWGLILLTSWAGANAVAGKLNDQWAIGSTIATLIFLALFAAGIFVQAGQMKAKK
jgi:hypothetical protein